MGLVLLARWWAGLPSFACGFVVGRIACCVECCKLLVGGLLVDGVVAVEGVELA